MSDKTETQLPTEGGSSPRPCCASSEGERKYTSELQELCDLIMGGQNVPTPFREVKEKLAIMLKYRTSKRIGYATDGWGGKEDETRIELKWGDMGLQVDITDERIRVVGHGCFEVDKHSANAMDITPTRPRHNVQAMASADTQTPPKQ